MNSTSRELILPLCSGEILPGILSAALEFPVQEGPWHVGVSPEEVIKLIGGMQHLSYEGRLRELGLLSPEGRLWDDLITAFQNVETAHKINGEGLFTRAHSDRSN